MADKQSPLKYFIAGGFGGICTVVVGHPLDTIKVRLQTMPDVYKSTWHAASTIVKQEGPFSLYKGMTAPLISVVPMFSISFFSFGLGKKLVKKPDEETLSDDRLIMAGMFSGFFTSFISAPGERIKCLLQMQTKETKKYHGFWDCAMKLWKEGGVRNVYAGFCATLLRDVPSAGMYFYTYESVMRTLTRHTTEVTWQPLVAGGCAGIATWVVGMPPDTIKSRIQVSPPGTYPLGIRSAFPVILKREGLTGFYRGVIPVMLRAFPANAACFLGLEVMMNFLNKYIPWL